MKIFIKTLKGSHFAIEANPQDTVAEVKGNIETAQGADVYPASKQLLIYQGKVLKDNTTLEENNVAEKSFIVIILSKSSSGEGSTAAATSTTASKAPTTTIPVPTAAAPTPPSLVTTASLPSSDPATGPAPSSGTVVTQSGVYGQAASNLVAGSNLESTIQSIIDMGGGTWDRNTVVRALRAAYNNPERAVEYLYSGIPEQVEEAPVAQPTVGTQDANATPLPQQPTQPASVPSTGPNANPLNLFPQGLPNLGSGAAAAGSLDFLRDSEQFQALRAMVQANPQILQPMLQELGKQNPQLITLIQEHEADFLQLMNEPLEGDEGDILGGAMSQAIEVTPEEREAVERLEAMGFDRATVLEVYFACNKNEELAANYLIDHMHEHDLDD